MSSQKLDLSIRGLYTAPNDFSGVPAGALSIADNLVINSKNLAESRRGQFQYNLPVDENINKLFIYNTNLLVNYNNKFAWNDKINFRWLDYNGTFNSPRADRKIRSLELLNNLYFTTDKGIYKIDRVPTQEFDDYVPSAAGVPKALDITGAVATATGGFMPTNTAVAYRVVWGYYDYNGTLFLGAPSQRCIVINTSGTDKDVHLTFKSPNIVPTSNPTQYKTFYQVYRSELTQSASDIPSDEMQLVIQNDYLAFGGTVTITDVTPENAREATLYTSPSQEGLENSNEQPPLAIDMDVYKNCAFYANVLQRQTLFFTFLSVDSPSFGFLQTTGDITSGSSIVSNIADTSDLKVGMRIQGNFSSPEFPANTLIISIDSATQVTVSNNATISGTGLSFEFQDRLSVSNENFWGCSVANEDNEFKVETSGTPGENIEATAKNFINVINNHATLGLYAYYFSATNELPGKVLLKEKNIGGSSFYLTSTNGDNFNPPLPEFKQISAISSGVGCQITPVSVDVSVSNGYSIGAKIFIKNSNSTPSIDGTKTIKTANYSTEVFTIDATTTVAGTSGKYILQKDMVVSSNDAKKNRVFFSKPDQPESVPIYRYFDIGSSNFEIKKVVALRDGIFFFKEDGIYRLSGEAFESFNVSLVDNTVVLIAPEAAITFNNQVYCMTNQGVVAVSDGGVRLVSVPIEDVLNKLSSELYPNFEYNTFAVASESDRLYMLFTISNAEDTCATQAFVYNSLTDSWTRWIMNRSSGVFLPQEKKIYMSKYKQVMKERKTFSNMDFADEEYDVQVSNLTLTGMRVTLTGFIESELPNLVGMTIKQNNRKQIIRSVNVISPTIVDITINNTTGFIGSAAAAKIYTPIYNRLRYAPIDADNAGIIKKFSELTWIFKNAAFENMDAVFSTNISRASETVIIENIDGAESWGQFAWGQVDWGGQLGGACTLRTYVPSEKQYCSWLNLSLNTNQAFTAFAFEGVSLVYTVANTRIK